MQVFSVLARNNIEHYQLLVTVEYHSNDDKYSIAEFVATNWFFRDTKIVSIYNYGTANYSLPMIGNKVIIERSISEIEFLSLLSFQQLKG